MDGGPAWGNPGNLGRGRGSDCRLSDSAGGGAGETQGGGGGGGDNGGGSLDDKEQKLH